MTTINQLAATDSVSAADQVPIYSSNNGDARKAAMSVLLAYFQEELTAASQFMTQYAAPNASGINTAVDPAVDGQSVYLLMTPLAGYAASTITLPAKAECQDGQEVLVSSTQLVTTLTVAGNGATVNGAPTTLAGNGFFKLRFDGVLGAWNRVG